MRCLSSSSVTERSCWFRRATCSLTAVSRLAPGVVAKRESFDLLRVRQPARLVRIVAQQAFELMAVPLCLAFLRKELLAAPSVLLLAQFLGHAYKVGSLVAIDADLARLEWSAATVHALQKLNQQ